MEPKIAKLFVHGGRQAVCLPAEFQFGGGEVYLRRDPITGDVILSAAVPDRATYTWADFFAACDRAEISQDFMSERPLNK